MKLAFGLPAFMLLSIFACRKPAATPAESIGQANEKPTLQRVSLSDTLPPRYLSGLQIKEVFGVRAAYPSGKYTCYYEYEGDVNAVLQMIGSLPFKPGNAIADTTCRRMARPFSTRGKAFVADEELSAASFFWQIDTKDYAYYECLKRPARHTILVHKTTGRILHRIESVFEV